MKTFLLYLATALAEIVGCYLPYLWLRQHGPVWLLLPAAASLALFAWLLVTLKMRAASARHARAGGCFDHQSQQARLQRCTGLRAQPGVVQQLGQVGALGLPLVHHVLGQQHVMPGQALAVLGR